MDVKLVYFTCFSPIFKGAALIILGLLGFLFYMFMKRKWKEPGSFGFNLFMATSVFIALYGLLILVIRPNWWALPY